jgi:ribonuclease BN (tRNA processing enzyme)
MHPAHSQPFDSDRDGQAPFRQFLREQQQLTEREIDQIFANPYHLDAHLGVFLVHLNVEHATAR